LKAQEQLRLSWSKTEQCVYASYRGISLIATEEDHIRCPEQLRYQERALVYPQWLTPAEEKNLQFMFVFDRRAGSEFEALLNTLQTLFICLLLGIGSMTFSNDANKLVLAPIERMISKLDRIRNDPLQALRIGDEEHKREQIRAARKSGAESMKRKRCKWCRDKLKWFQREKAAVQEPMETQVLERTIIKIGSLLALGFGEAGAQIIGQNMKDNERSAVMGMIPGRNVSAVFAFCDISHFTDACEVLQDQVMVFVNRIAAIVHSSADEYFGNPNRNTGDSFLLVWRLSGQPENKQQRLADMSLLSVMRIIIKINTSSDLAEYRTNAKLNRRIQNYRIHLSFGLHLGWAIEGAIGTEYKIDASYLSPNVNMAARLEAETQYYGAQILLSEAIRDAFSEKLGEECRLIDRVDFVGGVGGVPLKLYTLDVDEKALQVDKAKNTHLTKSAKFRLKLERQRAKTERWNDDCDLYKLFTSDSNIQAMRAKITEEFFCRFQMAYLNYEAGNWPIAKEMLEKCRFSLGTEDGASAALLRLIVMHDCMAPKRWRGYREFGVSAPIPTD
jgi:class 3 adenylate cyclase